MFKNFNRWRRVDLTGAAADSKRQKAGASQRRPRKSGDLGNLITTSGLAEAAVRSQLTEARENGRRAGKAKASSSTGALRQAGPAGVGRQDSWQDLRPKRKEIWRAGWKEARLARRHETSARDAKVQRPKTKQESWRARSCCDRELYNVMLK